MLRINVSFFKMSYIKGNQMNFKNHIVLLCFCISSVLTISATSTAAPPPAPEQLPASYSELYKKVFDSWTGKESQLRLSESVALAHVALQLWINTHDKAYREKTVRYLDISLADPKFGLKDFHSLHVFGELVFLMKKEGLISKENKGKLDKIAIDELDVFRKSKDNGDNNIALGMLAGYAGLFRYLDGEAFPQRAEVQKRLSDYWALLLATGDLDEDAQNYDSLGAAFLVDIARLLGKENDLKNSAGYRRMFERFRDIVSPTGLIPEYGDSYFGFTSVLIDRVYLLEYAAALYNDPSFLYAARKLYGRPSLLPGADSLSRSIPLINLKTLDAKPVLPEVSPSMVTYRMRRGESKPLVDKLILRTGLEPGAAMIMMDLYADGSHAHREKGPSIAYYEVAGVPLFHNLGRHGARSSVAGNLVWANSANQIFPGIWEEGKWLTMTIPAKYITQTDNGVCQVGDGLQLRNFPERNRKVKFLYFDNVRLEGPAGTLLLDDFESDKGWELPSPKADSFSLKKAKGVNLLQSEDHTQGKYSQKVNWSAVPGQIYAHNFTNKNNFTFNGSDYNSLKLDVKYEGERPYMHIRGLGEQVDLGDMLLPSELSSASAEQQGGDAFGTVEYKMYLETGAQLTRKIALTSEGFLVVADILRPAKTMHGWNAGQLWQLYQLKENGKNWYASEDDGEYMVDGKPVRRRMLVKYDAEKTVCNKIESAYHNPAPNGRTAYGYSTTASQFEIKDEKPLTMVMVVLPITPEQDAKTAADGISITGKDGTNLTVEIISLEGKKVRLELGADGKWKIER